MTLLDSLDDESDFITYLGQAVVDDIIEVNQISIWKIYLKSSVGLADSTVALSVEK